jgi:DNA-binding transcriptional MerR regulator
MKISKQKFRIGELATKLEIERFVIRFWEKEFNIKGFRSEGGQRFYDDKDLRKFELIKDLLYGKGFTISGAKKYLKEHKNNAQKLLNEAHIIASSITTMDQENVSEKPVDGRRKKQQSIELPEDIATQIVQLQKKLLKLRELL